MNEKREIKVFTSYSHSPEENAEFVRALVERLRSSTHADVHFDVWLDEERMPGAVDIEAAIFDAISVTDAALFVVNGRWTERERGYIRKEVLLLEDRPGIPLVVLQREPIQARQLDHTFATLKRLSWFPDDPSPDACFWLVFCGLTKTEPGPRSEWARRGREITAEEQTHSPQAFSRPAPRSMSLRSKPISVFPTLDRTYMVTEADEWIAWTESTNPPFQMDPPCGFAAAVTDEHGGLLLAGYDGVVSRFNGRVWKVLGEGSPALCLAPSRIGELIGTAGGHILLAGRDGLSSVGRMRDPVIALTEVEGSVLAIGSRGVFGRLPLVGPPGALTWIDTGKALQPFGFFQSVESTSIGLLGSTRLAVLDTATDRITLLSDGFDEGVRHVSFLGAGKWPYFLLTDAGTLYRLDGALGGARAVRFPPGIVITGCLAVMERAVLLAWSESGSLFRVSVEGSPERIDQIGILFAYRAAGDGIVHRVRWTQADGALVESMEIEA